MSTPPMHVENSVLSHTEQVFLLLSSCPQWLMCIESLQEEHTTVIAITPQFSVT